MNHEKLLKTGLGYPGTSVKTPFYPDVPVLFVKEKMFALFGRTSDKESVNLKTSPDEAWLQRETYPGAVLPGYHMNKKHWNTVVLDGTVPDEVVLEMMRESYLLVVAGLPKKIQAELSGSLKRLFPELGK
ncbi:MmcQ/YjbR family DNA-binding protein [Paenibacillus pasadenensis]|uniref:MmcQ/YjbR family DNA-binding protein n=1 Tax=Paenibacillus pasadenensis TaxID=217090 RepID=UPI00203C3F45|nr:MmcQ/YjbR family DNA-binding protein [Paenibacillus pasadenensis]MCM3749750.1 MmcQ/YjbR family DNA-binding protein [Paenibacillus pasadenensis]